ncbi:hypothetical protein MMC21_003696 [Puttea exsequens]|nr:hypothetical protein [Puttea exsequens]
MLSLILRPTSTLKHLLLLLLAYSLTVSVLSAPADTGTLFTSNTRDLARREAISQLVPFIGHSESPSEISKRESAELYWGPKYVGNLKLTITNPHVGYAGPKFPNANHINVHVDKKGPPPREKYVPVVNLHVVKYSSGESSNCLYMWDSETKAVVFDSCFDDFTDAIGDAVKAVKETVEDVLENADFLAKIIVIGALVAALIAVISSLGVVALA